MGVGVGVSAATKVYVGEALQKPPQDLRPGHALSRVGVSHGLRGMSREDKPPLTDHLHQRRHRVHLAEVETLRVRVELPDTLEARLGATLRLVGRCLSPPRTDSREAHQPVGIAADRSMA